MEEKFLHLNSLSMTLWSIFHTLGRIECEKYVRMISNRSVVFRLMQNALEMKWKIVMEAVAFMSCDFLFLSIFPFLSMFVCSLNGTTIRKQIVLLDEPIDAMQYANWKMVENKKIEERVRLNVFNVHSQMNEAKKKKIDT